MTDNAIRRGWDETAFLGLCPDDDLEYRFYDGVLEYRCDEDDDWSKSAFQMDDATEAFLEWMDSMLPPPETTPTFWSASDMATIKHAMAQATSLLDEITRLTRSTSIAAIACEAKGVLATALEDVSS